MPIDYSKGRGSQESGSGVSLSKVTLTKAAPTVSLSKHGGGGGEQPGEPRGEDLQRPLPPGGAPEL